MKEVDYEVEWLDKTAIFRITRSSRLNAASRTIMAGLSELFDVAEAGRAQFVIVTAEGDRAFCSGTDLKELQGLSPADVEKKTNSSRALMVRIARSPIVSVAAINGLAFGGGLELAMACTFRVSAPHATFALPEIKLGLLPAYAGTQLLPSLIGRSRALDMMISGRSVTAPEALAFGLVTRVVDEGTHVLEAAHAMIEQMSGYSFEAIEALRSCVDAAGSELSDQGIAVEAREVARISQGLDAIEGMRAFLEKRSPVFNQARASH